MLNLQKYWLIGVVAALCSFNTFAHQQKAAITSVVFNPRSQAIEVTHRFSLHDAEHAVKRVLNKDADIHAFAQTQAKFANYVYKHFSIQQDSGELLTLSPVGYELEGRFFWVYQEAPMPDSASAWRVTHSALHEIWPRQINTVNIEANGKVRTLTFSQDNQSQWVRFESKP